MKNSYLKSILSSEGISSAYKSIEEFEKLLNPNVIHQSQEKFNEQQLLDLCSKFAVNNNIHFPFVCKNTDVEHCLLLDEKIVKDNDICTFDYLLFYIYVLYCHNKNKYKDYLDFLIEIALNKNFNLIKDAFEKTAYFKDMLDEVDNLDELANILVKEFTYIDLYNDEPCLKQNENIKLKDKNMTDKDVFYKSLKHAFKELFSFNYANIAADLVYNDHNILNQNYSISYQIIGLIYKLLKGLELNSCNSANFLVANDFLPFVQSYFTFDNIHNKKVNHLIPLVYSYLLVIEHTLLADELTDDFIFGLPANVAYLVASSYEKGIYLDHSAFESSWYYNYAALCGHPVAIMQIAMKDFSFSLNNNTFYVDRYIHLYHATSIVFKMHGYKNCQLLNEQIIYPKAYILDDKMVDVKYICAKNFLDFSSSVMKFSCKNAHNRNFFSFPTSLVINIFRYIVDNSEKEYTKELSCSVVKFILAHIVYHLQKNSYLPLSYEFTKFLIDFSMEYNIHKFNGNVIYKDEQTELFSTKNEDANNILKVCLNFLVQYSDIKTNTHTAQIYLIICEFLNICNEKNQFDCLRFVCENDPNLLYEIHNVSVCKENRKTLSTYTKQSQTIVDNKTTRRDYHILSDQCIIFSLAMYEHNDLNVAKEKLFFQDLNEFTKLMEYLFECGNPIASYALYHLYKNKDINYAHTMLFLASCYYLLNSKVILNELIQSEKFEPYKYIQKLIDIEKLKETNTYAQVFFGNFHEDANIMPVAGIKIDFDNFNYAAEQSFFIENSNYLNINRKVSAVMLRKSKFLANIDASYNYLLKVFSSYVEENEQETLDLQRQVVVAFDELVAAFLQGNSEFEFRMFVNFANSSLFKRRYESLSNFINKYPQYKGFYQKLYQSSMASVFMLAQDGFFAKRFLVQDLGRDLNKVVVEKLAHVHYFLHSGVNKRFLVDNDSALANEMKGLVAYNSLAFCPDYNKAKEFFSKASLSNSLIGATYCGLILDVPIGFVKLNTNLINHRPKKSSSKMNFILSTEIEQ